MRKHLESWFFTRVFDDEIRAKADEILTLYRVRGLRIVTAESLTGGLIAAALTEIPGASDVVDRAFVVYTYEAKAQTLAIPYETVRACGAVSGSVARARAEGAVAKATPSHAVSVAVTGVAGPGPSGDSPAGRVHMASARWDKTGSVHAQMDFGSIGRDGVRRATLLAAFEMLKARAEG